MPISDYTPTVEEVGALLRARTKSRLGKEEFGTFNSETRPTGEQVAALIEEAVGELSLSIGPDLPDYVDPAQPTADVNFLRTSARSIVTLLSAMNVELSFFPEQVREQRSPYDALERRYNALRKVLVEAVAEARGETGGGETAGSVSVPLPSYSFPAPAGFERRRF